MGMAEILKELVDFIEDNHIVDEGADDGDGHYDTWRSGEFGQLIERAKEVLNDASNHTRDDRQEG